MTMGMVAGQTARITASAVPARLSTTPWAAVSRRAAENCGRLEASPKQASEGGMACTAFNHKLLTVAMRSLSRLSAQEPHQRRLGERQAAPAGRMKQLLRQGSGLIGVRTAGWM